MVGTRPERTERQEATGKQRSFCKSSVRTRIICTSRIYEIYIYVPIYICEVSQLIYDPIYAIIDIVREEPTTRKDD